MPTVSIIMSVYNQDKNDIINTSINSIINQTFDDFEVIICNDGSINKTESYLKEWKNRDNRIKIINNSSNKGLAYSLNKCINHSKGEFLVRHDIDDYSEPKRIEKQIKFLQAHNDISIVGSNINLFNDFGIWGKMTYPRNVSPKDFLFNVPFTHGAITIRKKDICKAGGYLVSKQTRRTEDYELMMRMYSLGFKMYNLQEFLYNFREDKNAIKRRKYKYKIDEALIRYKGFKKLGLMPQGLIYTIKPLIVGLIPTMILSKLKDIYYKR